VREVAHYLTGNGYQRDDSRYVQGFPVILLGEALGAYDRDEKKRAPALRPIKIKHSPDQPKDGTGEPGDIVFNSKQSNPSDADYLPYVGWVCVGPSKEWKRFGRIE
jgi:hypothetical protein